MQLVLFEMYRLCCYFGLVFGLMLLSLSSSAQKNYKLHYIFSGKDSSFQTDTTALTSLFENEMECRQYIDQTIRSLQLKGYIAASADSMAFDSASAQVWIYTGNAYQWMELNTDSADQKMLTAIGWSNKGFHHTPLNFNQVQFWQERMLNYYENNGYPFAQVLLDSLSIYEDRVFSKLKTVKGPAYKIDSIRVYGNVKLSNSFLQKYLGIENGSAYRKDRLQSIGKRLIELPYLKEIKTWDMTMTGTGSVLNLYIDAKKSSQVDVLVGFLPAAEGTGRTKLQLTGEANINLKNALGSGETIGVNWQQIQVKSPRLHLQYEHPFVFHSPFGLDFNFDLLKKDSSFLNLNAYFGIQYLSAAKQSGKVFYQTFFTNILPGGIDTSQIKVTKKLPSFIDVTSNNLGLQYQFNHTDYRFNPRRGNEFTAIGSVGLRKIKPNAAIATMKKDAEDNDFDFATLYDSLDLRTSLLKLNISGAHYFKMGKQSTLKTALSAAWMYTHDIFKNEMYQIGGYKLLRGFNEESIYASSYSVLTAEYRLFIGLNSYFFGFADGGWVQSKSYDQVQQKNHYYLGMGLGMAFETKAGIFNLSYAVGKQEEMPVDFRQSKIHFGLISLF